jgi:hypothetical protein
MLYPLAISLSCALIAANLPDKAGAIGIAIAWGVLLAGPFDIIENKHTAPAGGRRRVAVASTLDDLCNSQIHLDGRWSGIYWPGSCVAVETTLIKREESCSKDRRYNRQTKETGATA